MQKKLEKLRMKINFNVFRNRIETIKINKEQSKIADLFHLNNLKTKTMECFKVIK